jgi:O-antigen/teichoic acid export membrane protein
MRVLKNQVSEEHQSSVGSDASWIFAVRLLEYCIGFASTILLSRWLGPAGRGLFYLPVTTAALMVVCCNLSLVQANVYLLGSEGRTIDQLARQNGLIAVAAGGLGASAMVAAAYLLPHLFAEIPLSYFVITALTVPIIMHRLYTANLLTLKGEVRQQFIANLIGGIFQITALVLLWAFDALGTQTALLVNFLYATCTWAIIAFAVRQTRFVRFGTDLELLRSTLRQSLPLHASMVLLFLHLRADMFMVKWFAGDAALGLYSLAVPLAESILLISDSLAVALNPRQVRRNIKAGAIQSLEAVRICLVMGVAAAGVWALLGPVIIQTFAGPQFGRAYTALVALLPGLVCLGVQRLCGVPIVLSGRPWTLAAINGASLGINIALNFKTIPLFGPAGAGLASTISYAVGATLILSWTARLGETSLISGIVPQARDLATISQLRLRIKYSVLR